MSVPMVARNWSRSPTAGRPSRGADLLHDCRRRGMTKPAVGAGAPGFRNAVREVFPATGEQRCWFMNRPISLPRSLNHAPAALEDTRVAVKAFNLDSAKYPEAVTMGAGRQCRAPVGAVMVERQGQGCIDITCGNGEEASRWSSLLAPEHAEPVYVNDLRRYSMFRAVVRDSLPTPLDVVVINDAEAPRG